MTTTAEPPAPAPVRRRRAPFWVGMILVLAGLSVFGYVAWEMKGTNVVSHAKAKKIEQQTQIAWTKGYSGPAGGILRVPRFGKSFSSPIIKGFDDATLAKGVAWYPQGAGPGQIGNYVLAGHRITHGEPFSKFPTLRKGDRIVVVTRQYTYVYRLRNSGTSTIVDFHTIWPLYAVPAPGAAKRTQTKAVITLITCSELFHTNNRSVVVGDLVATRPTTGTSHIG